uniref:Uncharacterized protein n=1 Tax=Arundo donax TaxID=35708 RepID=A0A0A9D010_ARUDO
MSANNFRNGPGTGDVSLSAFCGGLKSYWILATSPSSFAELHVMELGASTFPGDLKVLVTSA